MGNFFRSQIYRENETENGNSKDASEVNETPEKNATDKPKPTKVWYGIVIFFWCIMTIFFVTLMNYFSKKDNIDVRYNALLFFGVVAIIIVIYKFYKTHTDSIANTFAAMLVPTFLGDSYTDTTANFLLSLCYLIVLGGFMGYLFSDYIYKVVADSDTFSKNVNYIAMNKYISSSVALWFAMLLAILCTLHFKSDWPIMGAAVCILFILIIFTGVYFNTNPRFDLNIYGILDGVDLHIYGVGKTVEVDDAGKNGHRWIRAKVRSIDPYVRDSSGKMTAVYVENPEYGEQGDNEEGNKNSRYSYALNSVRLPTNIFKLGDRVQVANGDDWKGGTVNGFNYDKLGNLKSVFVKRDDKNLDNEPVLDMHAYSAADRGQVRRPIYEQHNNTRFPVGTTVEVNDADNMGNRWIRAKVRELVRDDSNRVTAVYVENPEYGDQGNHREEGNKNSRFSYGLSSVRLPENKYKLGDRVRVLDGDTWKGGTVNGFTYHHDGNLYAVFVKRDDKTDDTDSHSISNPNQVRPPLSDEIDSNNRFTVGKTVEVNDPGPRGKRWIRGRVKKQVGDVSDMVTAIYAENLEYGEQGDNEEGNKNTQYSYGLNSVRLPTNIYKLGDRVQVLDQGSWKKGTVNGFNYYPSNGTLEGVFVNRDDGNNTPTNSYSIISPIQVVRI